MTANYLLWLLLLLSFAASLTDDDNFIIFTEDIHGYPVPDSNGYAYFISSTISKVQLSTRTVEKVLKVTYSSGTSSIRFDRGLLNEDEDVLIVYMQRSGSG